MPQGMLPPGSGHMRQGCWIPQSHQCIGPHSPNAVTDIPQLNNVKPAYALNLSLCVEVSEIITMYNSGSDEDLVTVHLSHDEWKGKRLYLMIYLFEKIFMYQFCNVSAII
jgi:hypothetical protein